MGIFPTDCAAMDLLSEIEAYLKRTSITETTFGAKVAKDGKFVARLRAGGGVTVRLAEVVRQWMRDNPPGEQVNRKGERADQPGKAA